MFNQTTFDSVPKFDDCEYYWFVMRNEHSAHVVLKEDCSTTWKSRVVCTLKVEDDSIIVDEDTKQRISDWSYIISDWDKFKLRPEYHMVSSSYLTSPIDEYDWEFVGARFAKEFKLGRNPDNSWPRIQKCLSWLASTDFYSAPASTQYHDSYMGGLLKHSLKVADRALELHQSSAFAGLVYPEDAVFCALVHDWCKIGLYRSYMKNVKDEGTGQWNQVPAFKYVDDRAICLGHGTSSMYLVMKFFNISIEEAAAIRHHMGRWNCVEAEINELQQANRNYPLVHLIQFADQLAIVNY